MANNAKIRIQIQHRDSDTGRFIKPEEAVKRPRETEKERIKHPIHNSKKQKK